AALLAGDHGQTAVGQLLHQREALLVQTAGGKGGLVLLAVAVDPLGEYAPAPITMIARKRFDPDRRAGQLTGDVLTLPQLLDVAFLADAASPGQLNMLPGTVIAGGFWWHGRGVPPSLRFGRGAAVDLRRPRRLDRAFQLLGFGAQLL